MNVDGLCFLVTKHLLKGTKGIRCRRFFEEKEIPSQREIGNRYKEERGEDFLIVKVIEEIRVDGSLANGHPGLYFLINKHMVSALGPNSKQVRRRSFFPIENIAQHRALGQKYAAQNNGEFLIVQVIEEMEASKEAKKKAKQNGNKPKQ